MSGQAEGKREPWPGYPHHSIDGPKDLCEPPLLKSEATTKGRPMFPSAETMTILLRNYKLAPAPAHVEAKSSTTRITGKPQ